MGFVLRQQPLISTVDAKCAKRSSNYDCKYSYGKHYLSAGKSGGERNRADGCLDGCFRKIGNYAENPFLPCKICLYGAEKNSGCLKTSAARIMSKAGSPALSV